MGRGLQGGRSRPGGIASLVKTVDAYGEAIDYDLMVRAGMTLREWEQGRLDSRSLMRFVKNLGADSAFYRASHPEDAETAAWIDGRATCALIADLIDAVRENTNVTAHKGTGKRAPRIRPYERPWARSTTTRYGKGPVKIKDFDKWYYGGDER